MGPQPKQAGAASCVQKKLEVGVCFFYNKSGTKSKQWCFNSIDPQGTERMNEKEGLEACVD